MPLTRQEVEALDFSFLPEDEDNNRALVFGEDQEIALLPEASERGGQLDATWTLLAAAPELALACLEAHAFLKEVGLSDENPLDAWGKQDDLIRALDAALTLAGVQP